MTLPQIINLVIITKIIFVENQLSLVLISLSPLFTNHPRILQHSRVQSTNYRNLFINRSTSFGSNKNNFFRFHYAYLQIKLAIFINSLAHYAKGTL